jgi:hypothetical protein
MGVVGPVELREVRAVLTPRLSEVTEAPAARRYGSVFVAPSRSSAWPVVRRGVRARAGRAHFPSEGERGPAAARPGARAAGRAAGGQQPPGRSGALAALRLAVGAASSRAVLSWPRIDAEQRAPSGAQLLRAGSGARRRRGCLPQHEALQRKAELAGQARLAWPSPRDPAVAIDETEYDLAVLGEVLRATSPVKGRARVPGRGVPALGRALRARLRGGHSRAGRLLTGWCGPCGGACGARAPPVRRPTLSLPPPSSSTPLAPTASICRPCCGSPRSSCHKSSKSWPAGKGLDDARGTLRLAQPPARGRGCE